MRKLVAASAIAILLAATLVVTLFIAYPVTPSTNTNKAKPFYVGVTYCGDNVTEAEMLIDKVQNYTNWFIVQSGPLQDSQSALEKIGDYAIEHDLHYSMYLAADIANPHTSWLNVVKERWGDMFLGVYFGDEPGGKMLDSYIQLSEYGAKTQVVKLANSGVAVSLENGTQIHYYMNGTIRADIVVGYLETGTLTKFHPTGIESLLDVPEPEEGDNYTFTNGTTILWTPSPQINNCTYWPNGTALTQIGQAPPYSEILAYNPLSDCNKAATAFVARNSIVLEGMKNQSVTTFTSDYGLYWWDFQSGYDMVLAEFGWNNSVPQQIALARGAAKLQNKTWGAMITWSYDKAPYLVGGNEMYNQMKAAYEGGAQYVAIFNYPTTEGNFCGILQEEQFEALQRFWNDAVHNPKIANGGVVEDVLVLPQNFGFGMRSATDNIWGLWSINATATQAWTAVQNSLAHYGNNLDIVFEDPTYPAADTYPNVHYYWNQTS